MKISVSYLKSKEEKKTTINKILSTSADYIHVDLMDGIFVDNNNLDFSLLLDLLKDVNKPLDIHLMALDPLLYLDELITLKPEMITIHVEANNVLEALEKIKAQHIKAGLSIKPDTDLEKLKSYYKIIDLVLVMSVNPGMGGQSFLMSTIDRLKIIHKDSLENKFLVSVDGGINAETLKYVKPYVNIIVSGYYICKEDNYQMQIDKLKY